MTNKILLVGVARSGTTWVGTVLSKCGDVAWLNEPDDERRFAIAKTAKAKLTRYPTIAPRDAGTVGEASIEDYYTLWEAVWGHVLSQNVIAKSVFVPFCLEWLQDMFSIDHVVWVKRDPYITLASWYEYSREVNPIVPKDALLRRLAWQLGSHYAAYQRLENKGFYTAVVDHGQLAMDAERGFHSLASQLGLDWTHEAMEQLSDLSTSGAGGHYGLEGYSLNDHIRRTVEQATRAIEERVTSAELIIMRKELTRWISRK